MLFGGSSAIPRKSCAATVLVQLEVVNVDVQQHCPPLDHKDPI